MFLKILFGVILLKLAKAYPISVGVSVADTLTSTLTSTLTTTLTSTPTTTFAKDIPIVVLHGIASSSPNMEAFSEWLENTFERAVFNIEIGNGQQNSVFMPLYKQLSILCDTIYDIPALKNGFDFIGMSQGGLLARGYLENCNDYPVRILVNLVSPNGGVVEQTNLNMYSNFYQTHLSFSGYWRDPSKLEEYLNKCDYLPLLNNEKEHALAKQYKARMLTLQNYIIIWSPLDDVINPPASAKFSFFDKEYNIIPLVETRLYKEDYLGLRQLEEDHRFHIYETNCTHVQHRDPVCFAQLYDIFDKYF